MSANPQSQASNPQISESDILARAQAMLPMLRERAASTELLRRLPPDVNEAFRALAAGEVARSIVRFT